MRNAINSTCSKCKYEDKCKTLKELKDVLKTFEAEHEYFIEVNPYVEYCNYGEVVGK